jgi:hypothetical protein
MQDVNLHLLGFERTSLFAHKGVWSRANYIQMLQTMQENGAQSLCWFHIQIDLMGVQERAQHKGWDGRMSSGSPS